MDRLKELSKKKHIRKEISKSNISDKLNNEIKATQSMLNEMYKKRYRRKKSFNRIQASDFLAEIYRRQRYKIQNGK